MENVDKLNKQIFSTYTICSWLHLRLLSGSAPRFNLFQQPPLNSFFLFLHFALNKASRTLLPIFFFFQIDIFFFPFPFFPFADFRFSAMRSISTFLFPFRVLLSLSYIPPFSQTHDPEIYRPRLTRRLR